VAAPLPVRRWSALLALLLAEGLTVSVAFDASTIEGLPSGPLVFLIRNAGMAMRIGTVMIACFFIVAAARLRSGSDAALSGPATAHRYIPRLVAHLAVFGSFAGLSTLLFGESEAPAPHAWALGIAWLVALLVTIGTWLVTVVPLRELPNLARKVGSVLGPSVVLGVVAFAAGQLSDQLWLPLRRLTFALSSSLLGIFVDDPLSDAAAFTFGTNEFLVDIAPQCSGYEGMGLILVFLGAALWLFRDRLRFPRAWWLLPLGALASFFANVVRLVALVLVGTYVSPEIASGGFHSYAGTLLFSVLGLSLVALALRSPLLAVAGAPGAPKATEVEAATANAAAPYIVPFLAMIAAGMVARAFSSDGHEPLAAARPVIGFVALAVFWRVYREPSWRATWRVSWFAPLVGLLVAALWLGLARLGASNAVASATDPASFALFTFLAHALSAVLVVPFTEELAFRGFLARRVSTPAFEALSPRALSALGIGVSSLAFGLLHAHPLAGVVAGVAYALAYRARGRLADAVVAHATTNAVVVVVALLAGDARLGT